MISLNTETSSSLLPYSTLSQVAGHIKQFYVIYIYFSQYEHVPLKILSLKTRCSKYEKISPYTRRFISRVNLRDSLLIGHRVAVEVHQALLHVTNKPFFIKDMSPSKCPKKAISPRGVLLTCARTCSPGALSLSLTHGAAPTSVQDYLDPTE